uniref:N-acetyltransferase domain-containing protein n=1 Tax=Heliothis virescens TaxID=7102 RepID=A0A2A4J1J0_HELVI
MALKVRSKFSAVAKNGTRFNFRIMDMPENLLKTVAHLYVEYFVKQESTFKASGVPKSAEALEEWIEFLSKMDDDGSFYITICCFDNNDDEHIEVLGASMMALTKKGEPEPELVFETPQLKKLVEMFKGLNDYYNEEKEFGLDRYFSDRGLFVCPQYRGLGIAQEFLRTRRMICKEHGIPINGAWMTSYGTQKAAERDGWETVCEFKFEEFEKKYGVTFDKEPPSSKFMIARIN